MNILPRDKNWIKSSLKRIVLRVLRGISERNVKHSAVKLIAGCIARLRSRSSTSSAASLAKVGGGKYASRRTTTLASEKRRYMLHRRLSGLRNEAISRPSCIPRAVRPLFPLQDTSTEQSRESSAHRRRRGCTSLTRSLPHPSLPPPLSRSASSLSPPSRGGVDPPRCENNA